MEKKKYFKIGLCVLGLIIAMVAIFVFINDNGNVNNITLELGDYTVNEVIEDEAGVPNSECGVEIKENNEFEIYMGWGAWHSGKYEIKDNELVCRSSLLNWESGEPGNRPTDVIFTFKIINSNKLELLNIEINDSDNEKLVYSEGLTIGMTYSVK